MYEGVFQVIEILRIDMSVKSLLVVGKLLFDYLCHWFYVEAELQESIQTYQITVRIPIAILEKELVFNAIPRLLLLYPGSTSHCNFEARSIFVRAKILLTNIIFLYHLETI